MPDDPVTTDRNPPVNILRCEPLALCCCCLRVHPYTRDHSVAGMLTMPCCGEQSGCPLDNCEHCEETVVALVMGRVTERHLLHPERVVGWSAEGGVVEACEAGDRA